MVDVVSLPAGLEFVSRDMSVEFVGSLDELGGGRTDRNFDPDYAFKRWQTTSKSVTEAVAQATNAFYAAARGQFGYAFAFEDCFDNSFTGSTLSAFASGATQLRKEYSNGARSYFHDVFLPAAGSVTLYEDSVEINSSEYTVNTSTGVITFTGSPVPTGTITADCTSFKKPVIFDSPLRIVPEAARFRIIVSLREIVPV